MDIKVARTWLFIPWGEGGGFLTTIIVDGSDGGSERDEFKILHK